MNSNHWKFWVGANLTIWCLAIATYLPMGTFAQNPPFIQGTKMSQVQISVSVDDAHLPQIEQVCQQLQLSGMNIAQTLSSIGVINGSISSDRLNHLYQVEGVQNVEAQQTYQLAPPSSDVQ